MKKLTTLLCGLLIFFTVGCTSVKTIKYDDYFKKPVFEDELSKKELILKEINGTKIFINHFYFQ